MLVHAIARASWAHAPESILPLRALCRRVQVRVYNDIRATRSSYEYITVVLLNTKISAN